MSDFSDTDWSLIDFGDQKPKAAEAEPSPPKGVCPKCGKHVGRGLHFHVRSCDGRSEQA